MIDGIAVLAARICIAIIGLRTMYGETQRSMSAEHARDRIYYTLRQEPDDDDDNDDRPTARAGQGGIGFHAPKSAECARAS